MSQPAPDCPVTICDLKGRTDSEWFLNAKIT